MTNAAIYNDEYYKSMRPLYGSFFKFIEDLPLARLKILDVGCGQGEMLVQLAVAGVKSICGLDFAEAAVRESRKRLSEICPDLSDVQIVQASIDEPETFPESSFDLIIMTDIVEHLPPQVLERGLLNVRRWLKPAGRLIVHTFPTLGPHRLYQSFLKVTGAHQTLRDLDRIHCNVQTRKTLSLSLERAGLIEQKLWLQNDFKAASSVYQRMRPGFVKEVIGYIIGDLLNKRFLSIFFNWAGLAEFVSPSIYAICTKESKEAMLIGPDSKLVVT